MEFKRNCLVIGSVSALFLWSAPVQAGMCGYEYCWGALAMGSNGATGRATGLRAAPFAEKRALSVCGKTCESAEVFVNSCAAFAEDFNRDRSFGWGDTRALAEARALRACQADGASCRIRVWACSP